MKEPIVVLRMIFGVTILLCVVAGCGGPSNVGSVSGKVTLDGQPLQDSLVTFTPTSGAGSPSAGRTDASGAYRLQYTRDVAGAEIGEHTVRISTFAEGDSDADPPVPAVPEKVPAKYNVTSELKKTVEKGSNTIDLPLESGGEVVQTNRARDG